jgi:hypothetical protein
VIGLLFAGVFYLRVPNKHNEVISPNRLKTPAAIPHSSRHTKPNAMPEEFDQSVDRHRRANLIFIKAVQKMLASNSYKVRANAYCRYTVDLVHVTMGTPLGDQLESRYLTLESATSKNAQEEYQRTKDLQVVTYWLEPYLQDVRTCEGGFPQIPDDDELRNELAEAQEKLRVRTN